LPPSWDLSHLAYAYKNHWLSIYNSQWCDKPSVQLHEIAHNIGLSHAGLDLVIGSGASNGNTLGMMGYSFNTDDTPMKCFNNAAKRWQLDVSCQWTVTLLDSGFLS
jgi:hypothetical protein